MRNAKLILPGSFEQEKHYYTKVINSQIHPLVSFFLHLDRDRIINRYCHLHPTIKRETIERLIMYRPKYMSWAGADLFYVTTKEGERKIVVIETNSSPSGQKSMPLAFEHNEFGGYQKLIENTFLPLIKSRRLPRGDFAILYDKNSMEVSGYASTLASLTRENVYMVPFYSGDNDPPARFVDGVLEVRDENDQWHPIRAALRYVTQKPWNRIPVKTKTLLLNPVLACLAGGRNKALAAKAYDMLNSELASENIQLNVPETVLDVRKEEIPLWVKRFGGHAVIKVPYSNAGQGVYTITNSSELDSFMEEDFDYDLFIVQSLIGNYNWSSIGLKGQFYHVGTVPNKKGDIFVADLRMMLGSTSEGFRPVAIYSRRTRTPLSNELTAGLSSWEMLKTNLSIKLMEDKWDSDTSRLLLMDRKDFNVLGIGIDDLIEGYIQTILAIIAIDTMAVNLINKKGGFRKKLFMSLNNDESLLSEIFV